MKTYYNIKQRSPEWDKLRVGSIGGTRFGQVISGKKNRLVYELMNETLNGYIDESDYIDEDIQFGIDNEPIARELYSKISEIKFREIGIIKSDYSDIHHSSPDGISPDERIILEIKCTQNGAIHLQRYFEEPETSHIPQIINYFAVSDKIQEVHWISYCPYREERPLISFIYERSKYEIEIEKSRGHIYKIEETIKQNINRFKF